MSEMPSLSPARPPGSLTAVMRAAAPTSVRKVLRVGLVHKGKVIDERVLAGDEPVTIGPNERATFVVQAPGLPPGFRLFERAGDHYRLQITPRMSGRIAEGSAVVDLATLRGHASALSLDGGQGVVHAIRLGLDARGKVTFGDFTVLFQFVAPAPALGKPQLPASVKSGIGDVDWRTSVIAAFSFLVHFGAVGSIYSDWMDPVVDDEVETAQILESVKQLPAPPPIEHPKDENASPTPATSSSAIARSDASGGARNVRGGPGTGAPSAGSGAGDARAHQISAQMASLELQVLSSLNGSGPATGVVLSASGELPLGMLGSAAASPLGARPGAVAGLDLGTNSGAPLRPGQIARGPIPGGDPVPVGPMGPGTAAPVRPPPGVVAVPGPSVIGGEVPNANGTVAGMSPGFRRCYNNGLTHEDPTMRGTVRVTAKIGPNGEVLSATASGGGTLTPTVIGCIRARVGSAQFSAPIGGAATLVIPVSLIPQQ